MASIENIVSGLGWSVGGVLGMNVFNRLPSISGIVRRFMPKPHIVYVDDNSFAYRKLETYIVTKFANKIRTCQLEPRNGEINCSLSKVQFDASVDDVFEGQAVRLKILSDTQGSDWKMALENIMGLYSFSDTQYTTSDDGQQYFASRIIAVSSWTLTVDQLKKYVHMVCKFRRDSQLTTMYVVQVRQNQKERHVEWEQLDVRTNKRVSNTIVSKRVQRELLDDIADFMASERDYNSAGIPYTKGYLLKGMPGTGKCHARDTPILMHDGTVKLVQDIQTGEFIMGDDSTPRKVISLSRGQEEMVRITMTKGEEFIVNLSHILTVKISSFSGIRYRGDGIYQVFISSGIGTRVCKQFHSLEDATAYYQSLPRDHPVYDISVREYLALSSSTKTKLKLFRMPVTFESKELPINPYALGYWLGDGTSSNSVSSGMERIGKPKTGRNSFLSTLQHFNLINNKHIPDVFKINGRKERLELLAGIIDSDGHLQAKNNIYEITLLAGKLVDDVIFLARSLGFAVTKRVKTVFGKRTATTRNGKAGDPLGPYYRIYIYGNGLDEIPVKLQRKKAHVRTQIKDALVEGFSAELIGPGDYYGFELDGNHRYLMGNFVVTHNSSLIKAIAAEYGLPIFIIDFDTVKTNAELQKLCKEMIEYTDNKPFVVAMEDLDRASMFDRYNRGPDNISMQGLLNAIDGLVESHGRILFITANDPDKIRREIPQDALMRGGRIDAEIEVGLCDFDQVQRLLFHYYGLEHECIQQLREEDLKEPKSPASIQQMFQRVGQHGKGDPRLMITQLFNNQPWSLEDVIQETTRNAQQPHQILQMPDVDKRIAKLDMLERNTKQNYRKSNVRGQKIRRAMRIKRNVLKTYEDRYDNWQEYYRKLKKEIDSRKAALQKIDTGLQAWKRRNCAIKKKLKDIDRKRKDLVKKMRAEVMAKIDRSR